MNIYSSAIEGMGFLDAHGESFGHFPVSCDWPELPIISEQGCHRVLTRS